MRDDHGTTVRVGRNRMTREEAQQQLIDAGLVLDEAGMGDFTRGHVSVRVPGDPNHFFMKPHSYGLDEITMEGTRLKQKILKNKQ